ncbi:MAG: discoidin domain-containing protein, partial [Fimbriimonadaceae bacterium]
PLRPATEAPPEGRLAPPVPKKPTVERGDDGIVRIAAGNGASRLDVWVNGKAESRSSFPLPEGGEVRAVAVAPSGLTSQEAVARFPRIVPMVPIPSSQVSVSASSYEPGEGDPSHATDGDRDTFWHSEYSSGKAKHPFELSLRLAAPRPVIALEYVGRSGNPNGRVLRYEVVAEGPDGRRTVVAKGSLRDTAEPQRIVFDQPAEAATVIFRALSEQRSQDFASVAEVRLFAPLP